MSFGRLSIGALAPPAIALGAIVFGYMVQGNAMFAAGLLGAAVLTYVAFVAPAAHLLALLFITTIVPQSIQNRFGVGGGLDAPGLLLSDAFIATGVARAAIVLADTRLTRRERIVVGTLTAFALIVLLQAVHGVRLGQEPGLVANTTRTLFGFLACLIALPILMEQEGRRRLLRGLAVIGVLLGIWALVQWFVHLPLGEAEDFGVRSGVRLTSGGRGSIQGGLYAFGVAVILAVAALTSGYLSSSRARNLVIAILGLNTMGLLLTFERTFWISTILGSGLVILLARPSQRLRAFVAVPIIVLTGFGLLAAVAPAELTTARERLLSVGQYGSDDSVRYRLIESQLVLVQIREAPVVGNGLAATIFIGRPGTTVAPLARQFSHNGYLWSAWKLGIPAALMIWLLWLGLLLAPQPRPGDLFDVMRTGARGALLALALASITFPAINAAAITPVIGLLFAMCGVGPARAARAGTRGVGWGHG